MVSFRVAERSSDVRGGKIFCQIFRVFLPLVGVFTAQAVCILRIQSGGKRNSRFFQVGPVFGALRDLCIFFGKYLLRLRRRILQGFDLFFVLSIRDCCSSGEIQPSYFFA